MNPPFPQPQDEALFRYEVIASLLHLEAGAGRLARAIAQLAQRRWDHPRRGSITLAASTIQSWLYAYRKHGYDALCRQPRRDRGRSRRIDAELAERVEELARRDPPLDGPNMLRELDSEARFEGRIPSLSTLYRFLEARGLDLQRPPTRQDHRAYAFDNAGDCWQYDVMYGPRLATPEGRLCQTYLFAFLDDATRVIPHAEFYSRQDLPCLKDALKQAFYKRGLPRRLYTDQGKIFRSALLAQIAARLGVVLIHTKPYKPQGRAKLERFFGTLRRSFLSRVEVKELSQLDELNRLLFAWVEAEYHQRPHRGLDGRRPIEVWMEKSGGLRPLPANIDLEELFLEEVTRRVAKDGTVSVCGRRFEAGPLFIGQKVRLRFDSHDLSHLRLMLDTGPRRISPVDLVGNRRVRRQALTPPNATSPKLHSLEANAESLEVSDEEE